MHNLTERQIQILKAVIEEYIATAEPVGSETLEKKHNLSASPATIRNEMVRLTELGYLQKQHSSAGRMPTPTGMKLYVNELMKEKELSTVEEVALKEKVWDYRDNTQRFLKEVSRSLAEKTKSVSIITLGDEYMYASGYSHVLDMPEFYDIDVTKTLLEALEEYGYFKSLFDAYGRDDEIHVLLGEELGSRLRDHYGFVFTRFETPMHTQGEIGVIGPVRLNYTQVVPTVRYFSDLIESVAKGW